MNFFEFTSCNVDPDVWMRKTVKEDGSLYWEDILFYTNNVLLSS